MVADLRAAWETLPDTAMFALLLYTDANAHAVSMLRDADKLRSLDIVSGDRCAILYAALLEGGYELPRLPPGQMGFLVPVWKEPSANRPFIQALELSETENLPAIAVLRRDGKEWECAVYRLQGSTPDELYNRCVEVLASLKSATESATDPAEGFILARRRLRFHRAGDLLAILRKAMDFVDAVRGSTAT